VLIHTCGPSDGPALVLRVGDQIGDCTAQIPTLGNFVEIQLWFHNLPTGPGTYGISSAAHCDTGKCSYANGGTITFTTYDPMGADATGTFSLEMPDGTTNTAAFHARQCADGIMCG